MPSSSISLISAFSAQATSPHNPPPLSNQYDPDSIHSPEPTATVQKRCNGCGSIFQHHDPLKPGYLPTTKQTDPSSATDPTDPTTAPTAPTTPTPTPVCQRCFHLTHYGNTSAIDQDDPLTKEVRSRSDVVTHLKWIDTFPPTALCVKVVDALDLHGTMAPQLVGALQTRRVLLAINKADVLPSALSIHELQVYARKIAKQAGVQNVVGCVATSALRGKHGTTALSKEIKRLRQGRSVYMVGVTNVGKSTLFNALKQPGIVSTLNVNPIEMAEQATVSTLPGTTMSPLKVRFGTGTNRWDMYDTPGIVVNRPKHDMLTNNALRQALLKHKTIKPNIFSVKSGTSLFLGGMGRIDVRFEEPTQTGAKKDGTAPRLLLIWNSHLPVHPTSTKNVDTLMAKQAGRLLSPALLREEEEEAEGTTEEETREEKEQRMTETGKPTAIQTRPDHVPLTCLINSTVWDLSGDAEIDLQELYDETSFRVSSRKVRKGQRQRTPFVDIDMGGLGWLTIATSYDDYMSVDKRVQLLQRAHVSVWGHAFLTPTVRDPLMPNQAGELRSKDWKTV